MSKRWTLTIEHWHPATVNQLLRSVGTRIQLKKIDRAIIMGYTWQQKIPPAQGKRRLALHIVLGKGQKGADPDAFFKSLGDACVHAGLLVDDSRHYVEWASVTFSRDWQHWGTQLTIEDIQSGNIHEGPGETRRKEGIADQPSRGV